MELQGYVLGSDLFPKRALLAARLLHTIFKGAEGHWKKTKGVHAFIGFIGNMNAPSIQEKMGFCGEGIILEAIALKLSTCWVDGSFHPETAACLTETVNEESVLAVSPVGCAQDG